MVATDNLSWRTTGTVLKDMLIATLGRTRMTESICCSSGRWLEPTVDHWESSRQDDQSFPLLWVGMTVLFKTKPPDPSPLATAGDGPRSPMRIGAKSISAMKKTELLAEANRLGMTVHPSWTTTELKAVIREHLGMINEGDVGNQMKKINSLNLPELRAKAQELDVDLPERATRGLILKLIRASLNTPANTLMTIGRWRGSEYREIPSSYGRWAVEETARSDNAHPDLIRYARWFENNLKEKANRTKVPDDESDSNYQATNTKTAGTTKDSWDAASVLTVPVVKNSSGKGSTKSAKRSNHELKDKSGYMEAKPDEAVTEEIQALELRLALLKDKARSSRE